jgi:hypothetical protein
MDILMLVAIFVILEAAICGICHFVCRDRHVLGAEQQPKRMSPHSAPHSPRPIHGSDHQKAWSHATDQHLDRQNDNLHLTCFPPRILP